MKLNAVTWKEIPSIRSGQMFWRTLTTYYPRTQGITIQVLQYRAVGARAFSEVRNGVRIHSFLPPRTRMIEGRPRSYVAIGDYVSDRAPLPDRCHMVVYATDLVGHNPSVRTFRKKLHADRFADAVAALDYGYPGVSETIDAAIEDVSIWEWLQRPDSLNF